MKTTIRTTLCLALLTFASGIHAAETARVITKENAIRKECRFFSSVKAKVHYNDKVVVREQAGDWFRVEFNGVTGCIHKSAIEEKRFKLSDLGGGSKVSSSEVSLAGKGFNPQVEREYKGRHPELDFAAVDSVERNKVSPESLQSFFEEGGLNPP